MSSPLPTGVGGVTQRFATAADVPVLLAKIAVERGCGRMEWSVLDWSEPAIGFYRKLGAPATDEWTVFRLAGPALEGLAGTSGAR
jgi:hypothetical protein